jgi:hypothetical protein
MESALPYVPNGYAGKDALTVNFYEFRTPDGQRIPIDAHIYGSVNSARKVSIKPLFAQCCLNGTTVKDLSFIKINVAPAKGNVVGSWKGVSSDPKGDTKSMHKLTGAFDERNWASGLEFSMPRLIFDTREANLVVPTGAPMLLQLSATTTIAVAGRSL